jgi:dehydrogenase/reductase SDR family protein 1
MKKAFEAGESIEFAGKAIAHLAADPARMAKTGKILQTVDLAREYGFQVEESRIESVFIDPD